MAASAYRKCSDKRLDFSEKSLFEQYSYETYGKIKPNINKNGYTYGKFSLDITLKDIKREYYSGLFTKNELMKNSCAFIRKQIKLFNPTVFFPYR